jgi:nicotinamidase-related amidase
MPLRGMEPGTRVALLISECQRGVIETGLSPFASLAAQVDSRGIVPRIAALATAFRAAGQPVVHLHVAHRPDYADLARTSMLMARSAKTGFMKAGSDDVQAVGELLPQAQDHVQLRRFSLNGFNGTDLDTTLRHQGVRTVVLVGVSTNVAINTMAVSAADLGYQVLVPEDCIAGASAESHAFVLQQLLPLYATITSQAAIEAALRAAA